MRKEYRFLKLLGAAAYAARQIVLTIVLVCSLGQSTDPVAHEQTPVGAKITKI